MKYIECSECLTWYLRARYRALSGDTNPNVPISRIGGYLDGYEKALEQEPCEDAISRQAVIDAIDKWVKDKHILVTLPTDEVTPLFENVHALPPVNPQPKTGHWIEHKRHGMKYIECSECLTWYLRMYLLQDSFCPNCGAKMIKEGE